MKLTDVDKTGKTKEEIKALRKQAWKRPKLKPDRDKLRKDRITEARGYDIDSLSVPNKGGG